jgi:hypothetical protein
MAFVICLGSNTVMTYCTVAESRGCIHSGVKFEGKHGQMKCIDQNWTLMGGDKPHQIQIEGPMEYLLEEERGWMKKCSVPK